MLTDRQLLGGTNVSGFDAEDVARLRGALAVISRRVERQVPNDGLPPAQLAVLGTIKRDGPVGAGEVAEIEGLNPTMVSRILGKLEAAGLVLREADPDDGRAVLLRVTRSGRELFERRRRQRTKVFADLLAGLDADDSAALHRALPALESLAETLRSRSLGAGAAR